MTTTCIAACRHRVRVAFGDDVPENQRAQLIARVASVRCPRCHRDWTPAVVRKVRTERAKLRRTLAVAR